MPTRRIRTAQIVRQLTKQSLDLIDDPLAVVNSCLPSLREQFGHSGLSFRVSPRARNVTRYELIGANQKTAVARESYPIHALSGITNLFWIGVTLDFQFTSPAHQLTSAGIVVFKGLANSEKVPLLRAEWHCEPSYLIAKHAQPHWHVYPESLQSTIRDFSAPDVVTNFVPDGSSETLDVEAVPKFHFAMCANWQDGAEAIHKGPIREVENLANWLSGCISYIASQLQ